ncbi:MAG: dihydrodipicolinate synthase family protein [Negativicutes bacterium]|nr:dihydrodipicolinate synthase family protein [Negativicutes bacterium]
MQLKGVYPAMATPLTPDEQVDKEGLRRVADYCLAGGVHGVVVLGSTGEFPAMTEKMREDAISVALDAINGKVPVLIGCGETSTKKTINQVREAAKTKADGVLVALPYYYPLDQNGIIRHYTAVADASELPVVMYNFPQMTKIAIAPETLQKLAAHPNIIGVKDSAGDFIAMQRYLDVVDETFAVMSGNPAIGLAAYLQGAKGGIYAGCSLAPKLCVDVYEAWARGDIQQAVKLQKQASLIPLMGGFGSPAAVVKFGLSKLGICDATVSAPLGLNGGPEVHEKILAWMRRLGFKV